MVLIEPDFIVNESKCTSSNLSIFAVFGEYFNQLFFVRVFIM